MTSGWQGTPYFRRFSRVLVSQPAISLKKSWVGYRSKIQSIFVSEVQSHSFEYDSSNPLAKKGGISLAVACGRWPKWLS